MNRPSRPSGRRTVVALISCLIMLTGVLGVAGPAQAATQASKLTVLAGWTQTSAASYAAWNAARVNRTPWESYRFDWSTDFCSASPDAPLGFDFTRPCHRHDFGYRNYRAAGLFTANKSRLDSAFHADLNRRCATYSVLVRSACYSLAWTYYQAVKTFGSLATVSRADLDRAAALTKQNTRTSAHM